MNLDLKWLYLCATLIFIIQFVSSERFNIFMQTAESIGRCVR